jgi:hypothetical protein
MRADLWWDKDHLLGSFLSGKSSGVVVVLRAKSPHLSILTSFYSQRDTNVLATYIKVHINKLEHIGEPLPRQVH